MVQENVRSIVNIFHVEGEVDNNYRSYHRRGEAFIFCCFDLSNNCMVELTVLVKFLKIKSK
jgi:hypothetical protein